MSDEKLKITIEGGEPAAGHDQPRTVDDVPSPEVQKAHASADYWQRTAHAREINAYDAHLARVDSESHAEAVAAQRALENADYADHAERQRKIARLEVQRSQLEVERRQVESQPPVPTDPVEAIAASSGPNSAAWIRQHAEFARNDRKRAKVTAAHNDALAEGLTPDSPEHLSHSERFVGLRHLSPEPRRRRAVSEDGGDSGGEPKVHVISRGQQPVPGTRVVKMTQREYDLATDGSLVWETGPKRGKPLGIAEYLRRRGITNSAPEWKRMD